MEMYKRIFVIVLDSLGIGAMPDAARFADEGADTFGHILEKTKTLNIPNLRRLGFLNLKCGGDMKGVESPEGRFMRMREASNGNAVSDFYGTWISGRIDQGAGETVWEKGDRK